MYRVALVGAGAMASTHARYYGEMDNAHLVGVADLNPEAAAKLAKASGATEFRDAVTMIKQVKPDVVDICVPTPYHAETVKQVAQLKPKAIIIEKPMAPTVQECESMIAACEQAGVRLFVAHVVRFFPEFAAAKARVDGGALGRVVAVRTRRGGQMPLGGNNWYSDLSKSGGLILDLLIHDFDWLRWTFGEVQRVYAKSIAATVGPDQRIEQDYALVTLRFKSGVVAHAEGTWADPGGFKVAFEIAGSEGLLEYNFNQPTGVPYAPVISCDETGGKGVPIPESPLSIDPYRAELEHFIACIDGGCAPIVTPQDALEAVRISIAANESARTGLPVTINP